MTPTTAHTLRLTILLFGVAAAPALAENSPACADAVGTYILTKIVENGSPTAPEARSLLTLSGDGNASFTDAAMAGGPGFQPFSSGSGTWICATDGGGVLSIQSLILDFTFATADQQEQSIARLDTVATYYPGDFELSGTTTVSFAPIASAITEDAFEDPAFEYEFQAAKITLER